MNGGNKGPEIVQANNRSALSPMMSGLAGLGRLATQLRAQQILINYRGDKKMEIDEAAARNRAKYKAVGEAMTSEIGREDVLKAHDAFTERYAEDHPDVISGKIQRGADGKLPYTRPELADQYIQGGMIHTAQGAKPGPVSALRTAQEISKRQNEKPIVPSDDKPYKPPKPPRFSKSNPKFGSYADHADVQEAVNAGKITQEEGAGLSLPGLQYNAPAFKGGPLDSDQEVEQVHRNAGLNTSTNPKLDEKGIPNGSSRINEFPYGTL